MQGLEYGNTVVWELSHGHVAFFDLLISAICDRRARVLKCKMQGPEYGNTMFWQGLGALPWPCYIFDLLISAICDVHTSVSKCRV